MKKVRILSIDGGGIRGIIPAIILAHVEKRLQEKTHNSNATLSDYFDLIAGTSAGGILSCLYVLPNQSGDDKNSKYFACEAIEMYEKHGKDIFKSRFLSLVRQLYQEKYSEKGLEKILKDKMQDIRLSQTRKRCLITAYDISERKAVFFTTPEAKKYPHRDYYMRDIARSTSAAPTYFKVANIQSMGGNPSYLVDGGMFANNPSMCAFVEVEKEILKGYEKPIEQIYMVSVGTGKVKKEYSYKDAKDWGVVGWISPIINILMSSSAEVVDFQLDQLFKAADCSDSYVRIEPKLHQASSEMDNVSDENIKELKNAAQKYIAANLEQLDKLVSDLIKYGEEGLRE